MRPWQRGIRLSGIKLMHSCVRIAVAAALVAAAHTSLAQETRTETRVSEEVIVTSTALRESSLEVAQPVAVMTGEKLRRETALSIGETIARQPGVSGSYFGPAASRPVIRGLGGDRVLVLDDGISALDVSSLSQDHAVSIEGVLAEQIEILKGPATLLYGSGAVGGVVNVIDGRIPTDFTTDANGGALELRGDTALGERSAAGRLDFGSERVRLHLNGFDRRTDDVEIPGHAFSAAERAERLAEQPDETFARDVLENSDTRTRGNAVGLSVGSAQGFLGLAWSRLETGYGVPVPHAHTHEHDDEHDHDHEDDGQEHAAHAGHHVRVDMKRDRYDIKAERRFVAGPFRGMRLHGTYNDYAHAELEDDAVATLFEQRAFDARANLDHDELAGWRGTLGVQYADIDFDVTGEEAFVPPSTTRTLGVFAFEKRHFGPMALELGARLERQEIEAELADGRGRYDETAYNVSAGGLWKLAGEHSVALNLTRSHRHPQAAELFSNGPHLAIGRFETGNPELVRETANTVDLTLHRHTERGPHWSLGVFYNDYDDFIFAADTGAEADGLAVFRYTQADARFYGAEAEITVPLLEAHNRVFDVRLAADYVRGKLKEGGNLPQMPPLRYGIELHYEHERLHLGLETFRYHRQRDVAPNERPTAGYTMMNADVSWRIDTTANASVFMFLRGTNLLDEEARRHISPIKEFAPLPGRSLQAGVRAYF